jgi:hypothetical protein
VNFSAIFGTEKGGEMLSAVTIGPFPELYFGPPYLVDKQHHPISFNGFCLLTFFASNRFCGRLLKNRLVGGPLLNDRGQPILGHPPFFNKSADIFAQEILS